ncbi:uncharacterized protein LOC143146399 isoform X2 [Ptiloglossa arizonensis]|uniref:uncharacterized protein LOC143146399 isoform X2 n=1 Tax=Ptiloglossa arizonensis TaxID=3350558 RepID=UPI003FA18B73
MHLSTSRRWRNSSFAKYDGRPMFIRGLRTYHHVARLRFFGCARINLCTYKVQVVRKMCNKLLLDNLQPSGLIELHVSSSLKNNRRLMIVIMRSRRSLQNGRNTRSLVAPRRNRNLARVRDIRLDEAGPVVKCCANDVKFRSRFIVIIRLAWYLHVSSTKGTSLLSLETMDA